MNELIVNPLGTVSPYCFKDMNCPGFLINYNNQKVLLDAGNGISRYMNLPRDLENLKIIISHLHPDHFEELSALCQAALVYKRTGLLNSNLTIYIPNEDSTEADFIHNFENMYPVKVIDYDYLNILENDLHITSMVVPHQILANAIRIDTSTHSIVYSGDTGSKNNLREFAKNVDLLICESTYLHGQVKYSDTHLYASEAGKIARDSHIDKLLLTHFWPHISKNIYVLEARDYFKNTDYAEENKKLILKR